MVHATKGWRPSMAEVAEFLNTQEFGRVGTIGPGGRPQIANVAFSQNDSLEIMIGTDERSRKATSLLADARVAFEATDYEKHYTVQFEGKARRLSAEEYKVRADAHFAKLPKSLPYRFIESEAYFVLEPTWVRFSDCSVGPWEVTVFEFDSKRKTRFEVDWL